MHANNVGALLNTRRCRSMIVMQYECQNNAATAVHVRGTILVLANVNHRQHQLHLGEDT